MRILVHSIFYRPDLTGVAKYTTEMCEWLAGRGHEVSVIAPPPHYPQWRVQAPYRSWRYVSETMGGVRVCRSPVWLPRRPGGLQRILYGLSFLFFSLPRSAAAIFGRPEVVMAIEPCLFSAIAVWVTARLSGAAAVLHVQDFEIDLAFGLRQLRWGHKLAAGFESWLMRRFDLVSSITPRMVAKAKRKGVKEENLTLLPNWVDPAVIYPTVGSNATRDGLGVGPEDFVALFAGSLGAKHGLEVLIEAARNTPEVVFVICGEGVMEARLRVLACGLANIRFLPLQPAEKLNELLNAADVHILPQDLCASGSAMPSKLINMLASGRPIVATAAPSTEIAKLIEGCGIGVAPGDAAAISRAVLELRRDGATRSRMAEIARRRALELFRSDVILPAFEAEMMRRVESMPPQTSTRLASE